MSSALRVSRYALYTYDWPSRTPRNRRGRSRPILGSATLTTVESRNTIPEPSTAAARIQRFIPLPSAAQLRRGPGRPQMAARVQDCLLAVVVLLQPGLGRRVGV